MLELSGYENSYVPGDSVAESFGSYIRILILIFGRAPVISSLK